jgi:ubiquinol-cytochrome c reductase cytochrome c1 subunit
MKTIGLILLMVLSNVVLAGGGGYPLLHAPVNLSDQASLQRGAKMFVNYCMGCHSAKFMRYNRMAADLGIAEDVLKANLMFGPDKDKVGELMTIAMREEDGKRWFGRNPPDLSVAARARGADWLYTYLNGFYREPAKNNKVDNVVLPGLSMPHALADLQGWQEPVWSTNKEGYKYISALDLKEPGSMSAEAYAKATADLVNFMVYLGEPAQLVRKSVGIKVILYLLLLAGVFYLLKREYWRDVH